MLAKITQNRGATRLLVISVGSKAKQFDGRAGANAGFARGDLNLFLRPFDTFEIRQQESSTPRFIFHNHAVGFRIQITKRARLGG